MGHTAEDGVVNFRGEVFGVRNLVVADNSIIPYTVDGNTSATAYLIGLNIAHLLLRDDDEHDCDNHEHDKHHHSDCD
jgi:choline dehydrogenase